VASGDYAWDAAIVKKTSGRKTTGLQKPSRLKESLWWGELIKNAKGKKKGYFVEGKGELGKLKLEAEKG